MEFAVRMIEQKGSALKPQLKINLKAKHLKTEKIKIAEQLVDWEEFIYFQQGISDFKMVYVNFYSLRTRFMELMSKWKPYGGLIYFHILLEKLWNENLL